MSAYRRKLRVRSMPTDTVSMISPTAPSNWSASLIMSALRCAACRCSVFELLGAQALGLDHAVLEHLDRTGHFADLVAAAEAGDRDLDVAAREFGHGRNHRGQRPRDRAPDQERQAEHDDDREAERDQHRGADRTDASPLRWLRPPCTAARRSARRRQSPARCREMPSTSRHRSPRLQVRRQAQAEKSAWYFSSFCRDIGLHRRLNISAPASDFAKVGGGLLQFADIFLVTRAA